MDEHNLTAFLKDGKFDLRNRPVPVPGTGEVQIAVKCVGVCGTDIEFWEHGSVGHIKTDDAMILGHEASGQVIKLGREVKDLQVGDRVAWDPNLPCGTCRYCKSGQWHLCVAQLFFGGPGVPGGLSMIITHVADLCVRLPDHVHYEEGAMLEPLTVGISACERAGISLGDQVLICGAGCIGLMTLLVARQRGAANVCVTDLDEDRLSLARQMGATHTVLVRKQTPRTLADEVLGILGCPADTSVDCTGAEQAIATAIYATKYGGSVACVGLGDPDVKLPLVHAVLRQVDIKGVIRFTDKLPMGLDLVASGAINIKPLVTHRFCLEEVIRAYEVAKDVSCKVLKVMIYCDPDFRPPSKKEL